MPAAADLFAVLGLPRRLVVDPADLEHRYHAASRAVHPDRYQTARERERELSLAASARREPGLPHAARPGRARALLARAARRRPSASDNNQVPPELAALVFETQEKLEALRESGGAAAERGGGRGGARTSWTRALAGLSVELEERYVDVGRREPGARPRCSRS